MRTVSYRRIFLMPLVGAVVSVLAQGVHGAAFANADLLVGDEATPRVAGDVKEGTLAPAIPAPTIVLDDTGSVAFDLEEVEALIEPADGGVADEAEAAVAALPECRPLGAWQQVFSPRAFRLRGNAFNVDRPAAVTEFGFQLQIDAAQQTDLYFSLMVWDQPTNSYFRVIPDVVVPATGTGGPVIYTTGPFAQPVELVPGERYLFAVTWGIQAIRYARALSENPNTRFPNFPAAVFLGSVSLTFTSGVPPVDPENDGIAVPINDIGGPWSMRICLAGACCLEGDICANLREVQCQDASGAFTASGFTCDDLNAEDLGCPLVIGACCRDEACTQTDQFACDDAGGDDWFREEVCDPTICLPKGACCLDDGSCLDEVVEENCGNVGGLYRGDDTACATVEPRCNFGACCLFPQGCDVQRPADCQAANGTFQGFGTSCVPDPCIETGACCTGTTCSSKTEEECDAVSGTYRGDGVLCSELDILCGWGACCTASAGCADLDEVVCDHVGVFQGDGTSCATLDPPCIGTCCWLGGCVDEIDPISCTALPSGVFLEYGMFCPDEPDPCEAIGTTGACCLQSEACSRTTTNACDDLLGDFQSGLTCSSPAVDCTLPPPTGACCQPDGTCSEESEADCSGPDQYYHGDETLCSDPEVDCDRGACCLRDGSCTDTIALHCDQLVGTFDPLNDCITAGCDPGGACCQSNEGCQTLTAALCAGVNGSYQGDGTLCVDVDCDRDPCCFPDSECEFLRADDCIAAGGTPRFDQLVCTANGCAPGACCRDDGTCTDTDGYACVGTGLTFEPGDTCASGVCPLGGACCSPFGACLTKTEAACAAIPDSTYAGDETTCLLAGGMDTCELGACCRFDGNCDDDEFAFRCQDFMEVFYPGLACVDIVDECVARGACCLPGGACEIRTQESCQLDGGTFRGPATLCIEGACQVAACCFDDGSCLDLDGLSCAEAEGHYDAGVACAAGGCPPAGACCLPQGGGCLSLTAEACAAEGGAFAGDGVPCGDGSICAVGACCNLEAECLDGLQGFQCLAIYGIPFVGFTCADGIPCPPRGACCVDDACEIDTETACLADGGTFVGVGVTCDGDPCASTCPDGPLSRIDPPDGWFDARQPHAVGNTDPQAGVDVLVVAGPDGAAGIQCWSLCETTQNAARHPTVGLNGIAGVVSSGLGEYTITLNHPLTPGELTRLYYLGDGATSTLDYITLPADVNDDGQSTPSDILGVIDCINGVAVFPCNPWNTDVDRSAGGTEPQPPDILRVIDLLNGAGEFEPWFNAAVIDTGECP